MDDTGRNERIEGLKQQRVGLEGVIRARYRGKPLRSSADAKTLLDAIDREITKLEAEDE